jgi:hypothetical protein
MIKYVIEIKDGMFTTHYGTMTDEWVDVQIFNTEDDAEREVARIKEISEEDYKCDIRRVQLSVTLL